MLITRSFEEWRNTVEKNAKISIQLMITIIQQLQHGSNNTGAYQRKNS